jgi:hypothetical protein
VTILGDDRWWQVATRVVAAVQAALTVPVERAGVVPGAVAWDECDCGLLAVSWTVSYPSDSFPTEQTGVVGNCSAAWEVAEFLVQVIRCAPGPTAQANAPTVKALSDAARLLDTDGNQVVRAVSVLLCTMKDAMDVEDFLVTRRIPQGPEGNCVGSEQRFLVALPRLAVATV